MADRISSMATLAASRNWQATPDNYSSLRYLCFEADGSGMLIYGYGQTIYLILPCAWDIPKDGRLRFTYSAPTDGRLASVFELRDENRVKEIGFTLTAGKIVGVVDIVPKPFEFDQTLELSDSPWPNGLKLPFEVPRIFYGLVNKQNSPMTKLGSSSDGSKQSNP